MKPNIRSNCFIDVARQLLLKSTRYLIKEHLIVWTRTYTSKAQNSQLTVFATHLSFSSSEVRILVFLSKSLPRLRYFFKSWYSSVSDLKANKINMILCSCKLKGKAKYPLYGNVHNSYSGCVRILEVSVWPKWSLYSSLPLRD